MRSNPQIRIVVSVLIFTMAALACGVIEGGGDAPAGAAGPADHTPTASKTSKPTATMRPTATPNTQATRRALEFTSLLEDLEQRGYLATTEGLMTELDPFYESWAQLGWYQWWTFEEQASDLVFKARFEWSVASPTPELSGCGFVFGIQENDDHYAVFLDKSRILFLMARGSNVYNVGKTRGSGRANFGNPAQADFVLVVRGQSAFVSVDGDVTEYTLSVDQTTTGLYGLSILSGTNRDYGTRCEMTEMLIWQPD
jgi:hypothetical protein